MDVTQIIAALAPAAAYFAKLLVDGLRMAWPASPSWVSPLAALAFGISMALLLYVAAGEPLTTQTTAQAILVGIVAGGGAIGATEAARYADKVRAQESGTRE